VQRRGGGGAVVLLPGMVVVTIAGPTGESRDAGKLFCRVNKHLAALIEGLGVPALAHRGVSDLCLGERKILGCSLAFSRGFALYQGCLLVDCELGAIERCLRHPSREPAYRAGRSHGDFLTTLRRAGSKLSVEGRARGPRARARCPRAQLDLQRIHAGGVRTVTAAAVRVPQVDVNDVEMVLLEWRVEQGTSVARGRSCACSRPPRRRTSSRSNRAAWSIASPRRVPRCASARRSRGLARRAPRSTPRSQRTQRRPHHSTSWLRAMTALRVRRRARKNWPSSTVSTSLGSPHQGELVKERDVRDFLASRGSAPAASAPATSRDTSLPPQVLQLVEDQGELPRHKAVVARHLAATQSEIIYATVEVDVRLDTALHALEQGALERASSTSCSSRRRSHCATSPAALVPPRQSRLALEGHRARVHARGRRARPPARTPVVHRADTLSLEDVAAECLGALARRPTAASSRPRSSPAGPSRSRC
jgi:hypothetical protein